MISEDKVNNLSWNVTPPGIIDIKQLTLNNIFQKIWSNHALT